MTASEQVKDDWPSRYDRARADGLRRPAALRVAVGVDDRGELLQAVGR